MEEVLTRVRDCVWEVPTSYKKGMRVPGRIFLNDVAIKELEPNPASGRSN
jgi:tRNA-splicing ligase RtcB